MFGELNVQTNNFGAVNIQMQDGRTYHVAFNSNGDVIMFDVMFYKRTRRFSPETRRVWRACKPRPEVVEAARRAIAARKS